MSAKNTPTRTRNVVVCPSLYSGSISFALMDAVAANKAHIVRAVVALVVAGAA
jgi:hypothetical protein